MIRHNKDGSTECDTVEEAMEHLESLLDDE